MLIASPKLSPIFLTDQLINSVLPWPPLGSGIYWNGWQSSGNTYLHPVDYKDITKAAPGWRGPLGKVWKDPKHGSFCPPWRCDVPTSQLVDVFANLGALWMPQFRDFFFFFLMEASSQRHDWLLTPSPAPVFSLGVEAGLEVSSF